MLARHAHEILEVNCYRCHGKDGATEGGFNFVLNFEKLAKTHVKPNDAPGSLLYQRISAHDHDTLMPPEGEKPRPSQEDIAAVRQWIQAGAPAISDEKPREFITNVDVFKAILADLRSTPERARKYNRYFTLTHLYNAGFSEDELQTYRLAFVKLINSLSWNSEMISPAAVDPAATVLRVDIRLLNWNEQIWNEIAKQNPYGLKVAGEEATACYHESKTEMPAVRVDWFVFAASRPPLYHAILALPESAGELEQMLHVNVAADIEQEQVIRAAFNRSGVSRNNRLIERHKSAQGSYWKSYDFAGNTGRKNLFEHPMGPGDAEETFRQDGGEIIFSLPNGLQGYMLVNGTGQRIDRGPTEIVSDAKRSEPMAKARETGFNYWSLIEPVWSSLNHSWDDGPEEFLSLFRSIRPEVGNLYAAHWCQSEVCNGGFYQFFFNTTGILAPEALDGFRAIEAMEWAEILVDSMKLFATPYPRERGDRLTVLLAPERDQFRNLDARFYKWARNWSDAANAYAERIVARGSG